MTPFPTTLSEIIDHLGVAGIAATALTTGHDDDCKLCRLEASLSEASFAAHLARAEPREWEVRWRDRQGVDHRAGNYTRDEAEARAAQLNRVNHGGRIIVRQHACC